MTGYMTGFLVYMLAMLGVIFIITVVAKKSFNLSTGKRINSFLKVESRLNLEPRKNLYVVKAGKERFLVSTGAEGCQFMTKIEEYNVPELLESSNMNIVSINEAFNKTNESVDVLEKNRCNPHKTQVSQIKIPAINLGGK